MIDYSVWVKFYGAVNQIASLDAVLFFLREFRTQKKKNGIVFYDRQKNVQALLDLEITAEERERIIDALDLPNYYKGPKPDGVRIGAEYWEFGTCVKGKQVYVKLSLGFLDGPVACFSFHRAERTIKYPYK